MDVRDIPLDQLHIANGGLAVRHVANPAEDKALAANIAVYGVIVPLLVRPVSTGGFAVVEGNRRLTALRAQKMPPPTATCVVDEGAGIGQGLSVNVFRAALNPMDLCDGLSALFRQGYSVPDLAKAYSLKQREVEQSLALSGLATSIKDKVRSGKVDEETAQALTLVKDHGSQERLLKQCGGNEHAIREAIQGAQPQLGNALFDAKEYAVAGGTFVVDLFSDGEDLQVCADDTIFWKLQNAAIDEKVKGLADQGWKAVLRQEGDLPPTSRHWPAPMQLKKVERKFHTLRYSVDADGAFDVLAYAEPDRGHKKKADKQDKAGAEAVSAETPAPAQLVAPEAYAGEGIRPFSQGLIARLANHRNFQVKEAICANDSGLALRALCWLLITRERGRVWDKQVLAAADLAWSAVPMEGGDVKNLQALGHYEAHETLFNGFAEADPETLWKRLRDAEEDQLGSILIYVTAAMFDARKPGSRELGEQILQEEPVPGRATFTPDKGFWESTSKAYMVAELARAVGDRMTDEARKALAAMKAPDLIALCTSWFTHPERIDLGKLGLPNTAPDGKSLPPDLQQRFRSWVPHALLLPAAPGDELESGKRRAAE